MRRVVSKIHTYGGLLCAGYLIVFGFSSLEFNHHFSFAQPRDDFVIWEKPLTIEPGDDRQALAEGIRDNLGLMGWTPPWEFEEREDGTFSFELVRPGKKYEIEVIAAHDLVRVKEIRLGFWPSLTSLHALGGIPNSRFIVLWRIYTEICTYFVFFAAVSGVYFWAQRRRERVIGWILLLGLSGGSLLLMLYIWLRG